MKISVEEGSGAGKEIIIRCDKVDEEIREIIAILSNYGAKLPLRKNEEIHFLKPGEILYFEYVDSQVFAYTASDVYRTGSSLAQLEKNLPENLFFRCSKNMLVNLNEISSLKSILSGRILATINNGEKIIISRRYASLLRTLLKGRDD